jgi:hypothetical protein
MQWNCVGDRGKDVSKVYSPKIQRRLTLFSRDAHDAWLLLEADPEVRTFCERPAYVAGEKGVCRN